MFPPNTFRDRTKQAAHDDSSTAGDMFLTVALMAMTFLVEIGLFILIGV